MIRHTYLFSSYLNTMALKISSSGTFIIRMKFTKFCSTSAKIWIKIANLSWNCPSIFWINPYDFQGSACQRRRVSPSKCPRWYAVGIGWLIQGWFTMRIIPCFLADSDGRGMEWGFMQTRTVWNFHKCRIAMHAVIVTWCIRSLELRTWAQNAPSQWQNRLQFFFGLRIERLHMPSYDSDLTWSPRLDCVLNADMNRN